MYGRLINQGLLGDGIISGADGSAETEAARIDPCGFEAREHHAGGSYSAALQVSRPLMLLHCAI